MKIGMIGAGLMVQQSLGILDSVDEITCMALYCRQQSEETGRRLQREHEIAHLHHDMDKFLADTSFDTVYIGVVSSMHYEYAKKSLEAGKHVICEKPFTSTRAEAEELITYAKARGLFLFEAIMSRYTANYQAIREQMPELGELKLMQCNYSQYSRRYDKYLAGEVLPAFDPELSGGSLYDINVYNVHFVTGLLGKPKQVKYYANIGYNGIDTSGTVILDYGTCVAVCTGAKDSGSPGGCTIQGTRGTITVGSIPSFVRDVNVVLREEQYCIAEDPDVHPLETEFRQIEKVMAEQDYEQCCEWMEQSLIVMEVLDEARADAGICFGADGKERNA